MITNKFSCKIIAWICRVCVDTVLIPITLSLCEIEYEIKYGERYYEE